MTTGETWTPIFIRRSEIIDLPALRRLAALNSRPLPKGVILVAELDGEIIAGVPLESDEPALGDPSRPTEDVQRMLELQARSLRPLSAVA
jgi:hypothetical protein